MSILAGIITGLGIWTIVALILGPPIGRALRKNADDYYRAVGDPDDVHLNKETAIYGGELRMEHTEEVTEWHRN
jgi:hypothetical protein